MQLTQKTNMVRKVLVFLVFTNKKDASGEWFRIGNFLRLKLSTLWTQFDKIQLYLFAHFFLNRFLFSNFCSVRILIILY